MTHAVPLELLGYNDGDQPLCPRCISGRLHPYSVNINFARAPKGVTYTGDRVNALTGWVAICVGNKDYRRWNKEQMEKYPNEDWHIEDLVESCGFWMSMTPKKWDLQ